MPQGFDDLHIDRNADFKETWIYQDEDGNAINLTGFSFQGQIKEKAKDATAIVDITITIPTPLNGEIVLYIAKANCETLLATTYPDGTPKNYVYDILINDGSGLTTNFMAGKVWVKDGVTEWA